MFTVYSQNVQRAFEKKSPTCILKKKNDQRVSKKNVHRVLGKVFMCLKNDGKNKNNRRKKCYGECTEN